MITDVQAFQLGWKPSLLINPKCRSYQPYLEELQNNYPFVEINQEFIFFQDEVIRNKFLQQIEGLPMWSLEFHRIVGLTLGFPPRNVNYFCLIEKASAKGEDTKALERKRIAYHYAGISSTGCVDDLVENAQWLWNNYGNEDMPELRIRIDERERVAPITDLEALERLKTEIERLLED